MQKQQSGRACSMGKAVMRGASVSLTLSFLGAAVLAKLLDAEIIKMENMGYGILALHLLAVFLGAKTSVSGAGEKTATVFAAAGVYYLCLLGVNALFFGGAYDGLGTTLLLTLTAAAGAGLTSGMGGRKRGRRRYKIPK